MKCLWTGWILLSELPLRCLASNHASHVILPLTQSHDKYSLLLYNSSQIASLFFSTAMIDCKSEFRSCISLPGGLLMSFAYMGQMRLYTYRYTNLDPQLCVFCTTSPICEIVWHFLLSTLNIRIYIQIYLLVRFVFFKKWYKYHLSIQIQLYSWT